MHTSDAYPNRSSSIYPVVTEAYRCKFASVLVVLRIPHLFPDLCWVVILDGPNFVVVRDCLTLVVDCDRRSLCPVEPAGLGESPILA